MEGYLGDDIITAGHASARINWSGTIDNPDPEGWVAIKDGRFQFGSKATAVIDIMAQLAVKSGRITVDSASCLVSNIPISAGGVVDYIKGDFLNLDLNLKSGEMVILKAAGKVSGDNLDVMVVSDDFNLSVFKPFLTMADSLEGKCESAVSLKGDTHMPDIDGFINISDLTPLNIPQTSNPDSPL